MSRPSVLVVDPEAVRRKEISTGLTGFGYEVVPTVGVEEGIRFAETRAYVDRVESLKKIYRKIYKLERASSSIRGTQASAPFAL